jgi:endonuclease/exonuclease/phosphatase family metal-dependent hydrolase
VSTSAPGRDQPPIPVRLLTFNVHHGVGGDGRHDLPRLARLLAGTDADLICLQEVDRHYGSRSEHVDQALLSRLPILVSDVHPLPGGGEPRSALRTLVELDGGALWVTTTHLSAASAADRASQAAALAELHREPLGTGVLVGDLNADAGAAELGVLRQRFTDAWPVAGYRSDQSGRWSLRRDGGRTHPARRPHVRIDQVWVSAGVTVTAAEVLDGSGCSDHHPLQVDLAVTSGP